GNVPDLAKRLHEVVGGFAIVFNDEEAHRAFGNGQGSEPSKHGASGNRMQAERETLASRKRRAVKLGGLHRPRPSDGGGRIPPEGRQGKQTLRCSPEGRRRRGRLMPAT